MSQEEHEDRAYDIKRRRVMFLAITISLSLEAFSAGVVLGSRAGG